MRSPTSKKTRLGSQVVLDLTNGKGYFCGQLLTGGWGVGVGEG